MPIMLPALKSADCIKRYENNPVLTKDMVPYDSDLVFNAGVIKRNGKYVMLFRNDYFYDKVLQEDGVVKRSRSHTNLGIADSDDGIHWVVREKPFEAAEKMLNKEILSVYDPRLMEIDGELYICFAMDTRHGLRGGVGKIIGDFEDIEVLSLSVPDNRNMVLFPEKINGMYIRLERPFPVYSRVVHRFDIWMSYSPDLKFWGDSKLVAGVEDFPFANDKIGPAAPPIKTDKGWLVITHVVDIDNERGWNGWGQKIWNKRYSAGVMLLDLEDPSKVLGIYKKPLIAPEVAMEIEGGYRDNVIFPCAGVVEDDGMVKIYYGASDTETYLAEAKLDDLVALCLENNEEK